MTIAHGVIPQEVRVAVGSSLIALCVEHGIAPAPQLEWSIRMRRLLGRAYPTLGLIRLSAWLDEAQAHNTMRHELAHIAAGVKRQAPHGAQWREWAIKLGVEPRATSRLGPANAPARTDHRSYWGLECAACGTRFVRMRVLQGLYHRDCGPKRGGLKRVIRDQRAAVDAWVGSRESTESANGS